MPVHYEERQAEAARDLIVREPGGEEARHLLLPPAQPGRPRSGGRRTGQGGGPPRHGQVGEGRGRRPPPAAPIPFGGVTIAIGATALAMADRRRAATDLLGPAIDALDRHQPEDHGVAGAL